jgi:hypothetical protein
VSYSALVVPRASVKPSRNAAAVAVARAFHGLSRTNSVTAFAVLLTGSPVEASANSDP